MGGHHKPELPKVPDWRIYKVEDSPELMAVQKALAAHGLRDPWLRNEVWKFTEHNKHNITIRKLIFSGFKYGLGAAVITAAIEYAFFGNGHGHGEDHKDEHH